MKAYISGGAKNGKSTTAQNMAVDLAARENLPLYYIATMVPTDDEDRARIARHREERAGLGFITVERSRDISEIISPQGECDKNGVFLLDSVTALLSNVMFPPTSEEDGEDAKGSSEAWFNADAAEEVKKDLESFLSKTNHVIFVSDYIYADSIETRKFSDEVDYTGTYIKGLAYIDRSISRLCDELIEASAGIITTYKMGNNA